MKHSYDLRRLPIWSLYIRGARDMLLRLKDAGVMLVNDTTVKKAEREIYNQAMFDYFLSDKHNIDKYLSGEGEGRFYAFKRDDKGRLINCKYGIFKAITIYEMI